MMQTITAARTKASDWVLVMAWRLRATCRDGRTRVIVVTVRKLPANELRLLKRRLKTSIVGSLARMKQATRIGIRARARGLAKSWRMLSLTPVMMKKNGIRKP